MASSDWSKLKQLSDYADKRQNFISLHLEALITVHVHKGLYLGNRFIDITQIGKIVAKTCVIIYQLMLLQNISYFTKKQQHCLTECGI